ATGRATVVGRATDPGAGLAELATAKADVVFLDIQMPGLSGFDVVERLPAGPAVVFTTADDHHTVQAFEANAADYHLKPVEREPGRLARGSGGRGRRGAAAPAEDLRPALEALVRSLRAPAYLARLASRTGERIHLLEVGDVTHVVARGRAVYAVAAGREYLLD